MAVEIATYNVELRLDGVLIGDIRQLAQRLTWAKRRTRVGVDSIDFSINDVQFQRWLEDRGYTLGGVLRPLALDCRVIRNGMPVVGGFLATMPAYQPNGTSTNLQLHFDGYINYLAGVFMDPSFEQKGRMNELIVQWITMADERAEAAGKAFGFSTGNISQLAKVTYSNENYKAIKEAITDRCDNVTGAGEFDIEFHPDRSYDITPSSEFGDVITDYIIQYPTRLNGVSATSISAQEVDGFASSVIAIGNGEVYVAGHEPEDATPAPITQVTDNESVRTYGYCETVFQESSVSTPSVLEDNANRELARRADIRWQPQIALSGRQIAPIPTGDIKIWIGDTVTLQNTEDITGMTTGDFRVDELVVSVGSTGSELIKPMLSRGNRAGGQTFAEEMIRMRQELLALKTGYRRPTVEGFEE